MIKEANSITQNEVEGEPTTSKRPVNRRFLLFKIDMFVLSFVCLQYWINYVDRVGFTNAYISGMKEDLNMVGNDLTLSNTVFMIGYIVGMVPNNLILLCIPPRIWLSFCTFAWGLLTLGMYRVTSFKQICAIRFFQALFESCTFSGTHFILGSWYKEDELPIRSAIFTGSGLVGSMFSGFMQTSIFTHLNGQNGLAGWRWLFIIDFCITLPISIYGFIFFPGLPDQTSAVNRLSMTKFIFTEQELHYARRRLPARDESTKLGWSTVPRILKRWHWWMFSLVWVLGGENLGFASNSTFALWLQNQKYTLSQRNNYPSGIFAVGIVSTLCSAVYISKFPKARHWHVSAFISLIMIIVAILIRTRPLDPKIIFSAQYLGGIAYAGQAVFFSWANIVCHADLQERAIVLASMNMFSGAVNAWWSILFFSADMVPKFEKGCYALLATAISSGVVSVVIRSLQIKENLAKKSVPYIDANDIFGEEDDDDDDDENQDEDEGENTSVEFGDEEMTEVPNPFH
ncbi:Fen2p [Saccharomyces eubayanus]|uniref:Fen2p n=1 Tax=Saccharomyces eubayanus TaxID=1080349 RepID=UPI0006C39155|nr:FEN2-like protein [Saccharomyces eubayanus]KOH00687.1 FEN2-like protein [Saccharomyces eubayanus]